MGEELSGFPGVFRESWSWPYPSADAYLYPLFHTSQIGLGNLAGYSSGEFDRDIDRVARRSVEPADRLIEYQHLEDKVCADLPLIPVVTDVSRYLLRDTVTTTSSDAAELSLRELVID